MKFSVIIPAYKMGRFIRAALESVGAQTCNAWEVIVVDDCGPDDGTFEFVEEFARLHPAHRVEFIRHESNRGVSGARNTALAASKGQFIAFLDPDDLWLPDYLQKMRYVVERADLAACNARRIDADGRELGLYEFGPTPDRVRDFPRSLLRGNFFNPSFTVIRREVYESLGGFDTRPCIQHAEDWDYWLRALGGGFGFEFIDEPLCLYRDHPGAATADPINIHRVCAECLRSNRARLGGKERDQLTDTLYHMLVQLAHLLLKDDNPGWHHRLVEAIRLKPMAGLAWRRLFRSSVTSIRTRSRASAE